MRPVLLASPWLVVLVACDFNDAPPVLEQLELACDADGLDLHLIANDVEQVTNVVVTVEHERADSGDTGSLPLTVYPDRLHGETEGGLSAWEAEDLELDCDETWLFELELTNLWGLQTVEQAAWPVPEPEGAELDPPFGSEIGGTEVTIAGDDLALVDEVTFDGSQATIVSTSASEVVVTTPAHGPGEVDVTLSGAGAE
ncbi:MAG: hypothetical protein GY884_24345, partial [Proteobacteria bacterium]|nr:hypothetical protein [Pseudomonadota bacterium]